MNMTWEDFLMSYEISETEMEAVDIVKNKVENYSLQIDEIVKGIVNPFVKDLDKYVEFIASCLKDGERPPTTVELEDFCLNLSTYIYFAGGMCEHLGIRDDIAKAVYKEVYHTHRSEQKVGTIADKDSLAELAAQEEALVSTCYTRAYKLTKAKVENAQELLASCKKVLSRRMQEVELTRMGE